MIYLTRQEQRIVILLCVLIIISIGVITIKRFQPEWFLRASIGQPDIDMKKDQARPQLKSTPSSETDYASKTAKPKESTTTQSSQIPISSEKSQKSSTKKININTATKDELMQLPGIGEVKAQNIIDYRNKNGKFTNIDDIINVSGIGEKTLDKIREFITLDENKE